MKKYFIYTLLLISSLNLWAQKTERPNIVVILADDLGYSDIGCYGGEIKTPNLDTLAANGLRYKQFYNTSRCCPTRASLLTGLYPHQTGMGWMTVADMGRPAYSGDLNTECVTIAQVLKQSGYGTYMSGKWHVTATKYEEKGPKHNWPIQRGFDSFFGTLKGAGSYFKPKSLTIDNDAIEPGEDFYYTDAITEKSCEFIRNHNKKSKTPFFSYVSYTAPHWPLHAKPIDILKYKDTYKQGWDKIRQKRYERMIRMGIIDKNQSALSKRDAVIPAWEDISKEEKALLVSNIVKTMHFSAFRFSF